MDLLLKILGGILLSCFGLILLFYIVVRVFAHVVTKRVVKMAVSGSPPARMKLEQCAAANWSHPEDADRACQAILARGFEEIGTFLSPEIPNLILRAFCERAQSVYAVVYDHQLVGVWSEFVLRYADNTSLTVSNAPRAGTMDSPPGRQRIRMTETDPGVLYDRLLAARASQAEPKLVKPVAPEAFAETFEQAYSEEMDWRNARGEALNDE